jgi:four helix bundle protein
MQDFRNLDVWHKAHELAVDIHRTLIRHKRVDAHTRAQLSKASTSIPANIVEGCGHDSQAELAKFATTAIASSSEVEYWVLACRDFGYFPNSDYDRLTANVIEVRRMLFGLRKSIRNGKKNSPRDVPPNASTPA